MFASIKALKPSLASLFVIAAGAGFLSGCSSSAQQRTVAEMAALNKQDTKLEPYLGGYSPSEPPRLSADSGYDPLNPELSDTVAIPFLSFLIIEPDPIAKNAVPTDVERLIKARQYQDAVNLINTKIKATPRNVQIRFVKARLEIEMRQFGEAKKSLIEITQQFPELPEPYNNLAAIAANQGNWIEARDYLELALKLRPTYVIASANLGEIYIRLGAQAYESAAKGALTNQRQYTNRAKALLDVLKPPPKRVLPPSKPTTNSETPVNLTNPLEGKQSNEQSTIKNQ
ncbi:tetratricopeptide repeat protein [Polynucleobacter sp.]|uniref:tetratricopeptide repeat protein n=1 Tax=Polynucleobacter sp. TaxID=2029855 RepID=UPI00262172B4|nr:tetratricopeptide repeat protein [Polynucleobacter sp.]MCW1964873.1 tetratricopeptide repeat protein [Polynucleobacter sp.]